MNVNAFLSGTEITDWLQDLRNRRSLCVGPWGMGRQKETARPPTKRALYFLVVSELVFEVTQEADGGFVAECLTESIFTQADNWEELQANAREAVEAFFRASERPAAIRLHLVRDEVLAVG